MLFLKLSSVKLSFARGEIDKMKPSVRQRELKSLKHFKKMILDIIPDLLISIFFTSLIFFSKLVKIKKNPEISRCCKRHAPSPRVRNN